jgi:Uncharacterized membrane-associated protein
MDILKALLHALWQQDYEMLSDPTLVWAIYGVLFLILFLENGLLPAAFLPGDSLLILVGVLIAKGTMGFPLTILILTTGASLGCWVSYIQGRWLGEYANGTEVALAPSGAISSTRAQLIPSPWSFGLADRSVHCLCAHPAADHSGAFWPE